MAYIIEYKFSRGWDVLNEFVLEDSYDTKEEASEAIADLIQTTQQVFEDGDIDEPYDPKDFRVRELRNYETVYCWGYK